MDGILTKSPSLCLASSPSKLWEWSKRLFWDAGLIKFAIFASYPNDRTRIWASPSSFPRRSRGQQMLFFVHVLVRWPRNPWTKMTLDFLSEFYELIVIGYSLCFDWRRTFKKSLTADGMGSAVGRGCVLENCAVGWHRGMYWKTAGCY